MNYFKDSDNFYFIIEKHFANAKDIHLIQTGWTNFVFKVNANNQDFIFRFPRNSFFAKALIKEINFLEFLRDKVSVEVPNLKLFYSESRPYSIHKCINGTSLSDCYTSLTDEQKRTLASDIVKFITELQTININNKIFQKVSDFLDDLSHVSQNDYDLTQHKHLKALEKNKLCISHGDFNPGNLILKNGKLVAVIDFAFAGVSHPMVDISRLLGRTPEDFKKYIISELKKENYSINETCLDNLNSLWKYVEQQYILYIKQNHPSIQLPTLV